MNYMRPDEQATQAQIEKAKESDERLASGVNFAKNIAGTAAGLSIFGKAAPFLSELIPVDLAVKGISKVSPTLGKFLKRGKSMGLDVAEGLEYLRSRARGPSESKREEGNLIQQYSPELDAFIREKIGEGMTPLQAGAVASVDKRFKDHIQKMTKDNGVQFSNIVEMSYPSGETATDSRAKRQEPAKSNEWSDFLETIRSL